MASATASPFQYLRYVVQQLQYLDGDAEAHAVEQLELEDFLGKRQRCSVVAHGPAGPQGRQLVLRNRQDQTEFGVDGSGPAGATGPQGPAGPQGVKGDTGAASTGAGWSIPTGSRSKGDPGVRERPAAPSAPTVRRRPSGPAGAGPREHPRRPVS